MIDERFERMKRKRNCRVSKDNLKTSIQKVLHALDQYGFPKLKNPKSSITFNIY